MIQFMKPLHNAWEHLLIPQPKCSSLLQTTSVFYIVTRSLMATVRSANIKAGIVTDMLFISGSLFDLDCQLRTCMYELHFTYWY